MLPLSLLFLVLAALYASVGFAGGTAYNAVLAFTSLSAREIGFTALLCNTAASLAGCVARWRGGQPPPVRGLWLAVASVPAAYLGGRMPVAGSVYFHLLGATLVVAALALWGQASSTGEAGPAPDRRPRPGVLALTGGAIGFLSGLVGIGGGVFLASIAHRLRWDEPRRLASWFCWFILLNSVAGLAGRVMQAGVLPIQPRHGLLALAVAVGGAVGASVGRRMAARPLIRLTAAFILIAGAQAIRRGMTLAV